MSSSNYSIERDSINFGGGLSDSPNYIQESTFGEIATGPSESLSYKLLAGYQQMDDVFLSLSSSGNVTLLPAIDGIVGGTADGSSTVTVTTDNSAGYALYIRASSSPALVSGSNSFTDYTPTGADPDFVFSIAISSSAFAFTPEGSDIVAKYRDDSSVCNAGVNVTAERCWLGLTTGNELISQSFSPNYPAGAITTLRFRAESGSSNTQPAGTYIATTTVRAIAL